MDTATYTTPNDVRASLCQPTDPHFPIRGATLPAGTVYTVVRWGGYGGDPDTGQRFRLVFIRTSDGTTYRATNTDLGLTNPDTDHAWED